MVLSEKKKNILVIILALIVLVIVAGAFLFWPEDSHKEPVFEKHVDDFVIKGNIITNEKEGLKIVIPDGWTAEKEEQIYSFRWGVRILSPDVEFELDDDFDNTYLLNKGCGVSVRIDEGEGNVRYVNDILTNAGLDTKISSLDSGEDVSIFKIGNDLALKESDEGKRITFINMPLKNDNLLYLDFNSSAEDIDFCYEEFNKFLEEVEIKK